MGRNDGEELQVGDDVKEIFNGIIADPATEAVAEQAAAEAEAVAEQAAAEAEAVAEEAAAEAAAVAEEVPVAEVVEPLAYDNYAAEPAPAFDYGYSAPQDTYTAAPSYTYDSQPQGNGKEGLAITGMILGIVAFFFNPVYVLSILAIVFGSMGLKSSKRGMAIAGLICGIASLVGQLTFDVVFTILTFGAGAFSCCV